MGAFAKWVQVLEHARDEVGPEGRKVVEKGAYNIKDYWRAKWGGFRHAPDLPYAVTYDIFDEGDRVRAEIGPDKNKRQGALGNLLEFGSENNAPHPGGSPALDAEGPRFEQAVADLAEKLLS
jgi:hypothetical protein